MSREPAISQQDKDYICYLRGFAIISIVFGHVGGYWAFQPFSSYLHVCGSTFFFFLSGAVLYHSFKRSKCTSSFYLRRYTNLLLPYYLICVVSLVVFVGNHHALPKFSVDNLILWLTISPKEATMPFPLGQLWFLYTYVGLILFTPLYVRIYEMNRKLFQTTFMVFFSLAVVRYFAPDEMIGLSASYKYLFFSIFFLAGIYCFSNKEKHLRVVSITVFLISLTALAILALNNHSLPDITPNFIRKDVVLVLATMLLVCPVVLFKDQAYKIISYPPLVPAVLKFFHKHTFSVYLLHTFSIYLVEVHLHLVEPKQKDALYGMQKFAAVLLLTSVLAVPFTILSKRFSEMIISAVNRGRGRTTGVGCDAGALKPGSD